MVIRRIDPWSLGRIYGAISAAVGLAFGVFFALLSFAGLAFAPAEEAGGLLGPIVGFAGVVVLPILYGCFGLIAGAIGALLYNLFAGAVGGIELDIS